MPPVRRRVHILLEQLFGRLNDALFCVSREDARDAVRLGIARRERTYFIANGASSQRFDPGPASAEWRVAAREEFSIPAGATVITLMGRLVREKGTLEFMRVAARLAEEFRNLHFLVVGDTVTSEHDDAKTHILELARDPRLAGRVHFTGLRRDIPRLLAASDIFALPSWREGMPVSILEAMMMGLPVVATRIRGCREEVVDGETGFLVRPRDEEELHGALRHLVLHPERAMALGAAGRARALRHFDEAVILQRQVALYRRLLRRRHGAGGGGAR
jgi:glycosyltransferase involved in cell wall biosynthesis